MHISEQTIHKLEKLSNIKVDNVEQTIQDLEGVIGFMDNISKFDIDVEVIEEENKDIFREDTPNNNDIFEKMNGSNISDNYFVVPKIIE